MKALPEYQVSILGQKNCILTSRLRHGLQKGGILLLLGRLAFFGIFIIFRASRILGIFRIFKICKIFRIFQTFQTFSEFLEFPYFQTFQSFKNFQKNSKNFPNFQNFQVFQIFKLLLELMKLQKGLTLFLFLLDFLVFVPLPSISLQAQELLGCGWQFVKPGFTCFCFLFVKNH